MGPLLLLLVFLEPQPHILFAPVHVCPLLVCTPPPTHTQAVYAQYFGEPNSHKSHELLHTHYQERSGEVRRGLDCQGGWVQQLGAVARGC